MEGWLITHKDCLDGATAGLVGLASGLDVLFADPDRAGEVLSQISDDRPIYLADISLPKEQWPLWANRISHLLDHHLTALGLASFSHTTVDLTRAGSHLFYDFAVEQGWIRANEDWERLILNVEQLDLWKSEHEAGQNLGRLFRYYGWDWYRSRFTQGWVPYTSEESETLARLIREEQIEIQQDLAHHLSISAKHHKIAGVWRQEEGPTNEVAHRLIQQGYDLIIIYKADGRLSARSSDSLNAAKLMERLFSGGGHAQAAGGRVPDDIPRDIEGLRQILARIAAAVA